MSCEREFPQLVVQTLSGDPVVLPDSLGAEIALVAIVFRRSAQAMADTWMSAAEREFASMPGFQFFEVPVLSGGWRTISGFIENGMKTGVAPEHHRRVATYYGGTDRVRERLGIGDPGLVYAYLIDGSGCIHWRANGWAHESVVDELRSLVAHLIER